MAQKRYSGHYSTRREGLVSELPFRERAKMNLRHHKWQTKSFLEKHGPILLLGSAVVAMLYFRRELKNAIGSEGQYPRLTP